MKKFTYGVGKLLESAVAVGAFLALIAFFVMLIKGSYQDTDLVNLFGVLLTFLALIGTGIYLWVREKLKTDVEGLLQRTKRLISTENRIVASVSFWEIYNQDGKKDEQVAFLQLAVRSARQALAMAQQVNDPGLSEDLVLMAKNNLAYFLADLKVFTDRKNEKFDEYDRRMAIQFKNEIEELITSGRSENMLARTSELKDTCDWVRKCFE